MYLSVAGPPPPPPPSLLCKAINVGCPAPQPVNPDNLASLYYGLATEIPTPGDAAGSTNSSTVVGLGCAGDGSCGCGGRCQKGMGLFDSGTDLSGWGLPEWGLVGLGLFAVVSMVSTTSRGVRSAAELTTKKGRRRRRRRAKLMESSGLF